MNITLRLIKVEYEMLKELQKKYKKYKKGLGRKFVCAIQKDYAFLD